MELENRVSFTVTNPSMKLENSYVNVNALANRDCLPPHDYNSIIYLYRVKETKRIEEEYYQKRKEYLKSLSELEIIINIYNELKEEKKDIFSTDRSIEDFLIANLKTDDIDKEKRIAVAALENKIDKVCALLEMAETYKDKKEILTDFGII